MTMIREISIRNYKSIRRLTIELGRVNVFIGANGSGKSNILEAIALGSASDRNKLDNEYLAPRGVRVVEPRFMRSAFPDDDGTGAISVSFRADEGPTRIVDVDPERLAGGLTYEGLEPPGVIGVPRLPVQSDTLRESLLDQVKRQLPGLVFERDELRAPLAIATTPDFHIYAPENSVLRIFQSETQILPLGMKGEGLFAHLKALSKLDGGSRLLMISDCLALLDWFERFEIPQDLAPGERSLLIRDRYLVEGALFDQRSANEGFLFLLFYLTLFISDSTPAFFAIDNVDSSLNPKLVTRVIEKLVELAGKHNKQIIFTTHNPAVLDGINLHDDEQRLFVTERMKDGATRVRRVKAPKPLTGDQPLKLSEAFVRGYLGGLPKNF
jgi:predicted ATPase